MNRENLSGVIDTIEKELRWCIRRKYLRDGIKEYIKKPYMMTKEQKKQLESYWKKYTKHFSPLWHEFYYQKTGVFDVHFIPEDLQFTEIEDYLNDWKASYGLDNKNNYQMYFPEVIHPRVVFRKMRNFYHDENYNIISENEAIEKCIECGNVIFKVAVQSGKGSGISFWKLDDGTESLIRIIKNAPGEFVAQEIVKQNKEIERINPSSVQIIRVSTLLSKNNNIQVIKAFFQFGRTNSRISQEIAGGAQVSINPDGTLCKYDWDVNYDNCEKHPNGLVYEGYKVPGYEKVCEAAISLHKKIGDFRLIHWDFAVDEENNPVFIEMNLNYGGINAHQLGSGPFYGENTDDLLNEVYGRNK